MQDHKLLPVKHPKAFQLFLLGFATLFLELALIRYLAGNIWNLGYFPNLVLLAVFMGMGIGFIFHHYISDRFSTVLFHGAFLLLTVLILYVFFEHPTVPGMTPWKTEIGGELYFTYSFAGPQETNYYPFIICFVSIILTFVLISQRTAKLFRLFKPLTAYTLDIAGSCTGILAFMAVSWFHIPAYVWFFIFLLIFLGAMPDGWKTKWIPIPLAAIIIFVAFTQDQTLIANKNFEGLLDARWSPYQKLEYTNNPKYSGLYHRAIWANGMEHQSIYEGDKIRESYYQFPYHRRAKMAGLEQYKDVLIIGAGSGNDVLAALANDIEFIDAVEIDPVIAEFGTIYNDSKPYQNPKVRLTVDDGRAFMTRTDRTYDLVIFALTDSLVKVSSMAQLRLENYLFTVESVKRAYSLLNPGGDLLLYNYYRTDWLVYKIKEMLFQATGQEPLVFGSKVSALTAIMVSKTGEPAKNLPAPKMDVPTDDWPFLYLKTKGIPGIYFYSMLGIGIFILCIVLVLQILGRKVSNEYGTGSVYIKIAFIFMGVAFLLLETKSVIQFSLLFGTTWLNNSLVFLAVLLLVLAANWTAMVITRKKWLWVIFALLLLSSLITLIYPLGALLNLDSVVLRFIFASLLTFLPIFFANLIFSITFRDQTMPEHLFGWNLVGATIGGVVEYTSMALGYNLLTLIVAGSYTVVFICLIAALKKAKKQRAAV